jgi:hypothetical protein
VSAPRYGFTVPMDLRFHPDKPQKPWEVRKEIRYLSRATQRAYTVEKGFFFDGASVPRLPFAYAFFGNRAWLASLVHDYCYEHGLGTKHEADTIFAEIMDMTGEPAWRRFFMHAAVKVGGVGNFDPLVTPDYGFVQPGD